MPPNDDPREMAAEALRLAEPVGGYSLPPERCGRDVTCHECDRDGDARCGLAPDHDGDHEPAVDVEERVLRRMLESLARALLAALDDAERLRAAVQRLADRRPDFHLPNEGCAQLYGDERAQWCSACIACDALTPAAEAKETAT